MFSVNEIEESSKQAGLFLANLVNEALFEPKYKEDLLTALFSTFLSIVENYDLNYTHTLGRTIYSNPVEFEKYSRAASLLSTLLSSFKGEFFLKEYFHLFFSASVKRIHQDSTIIYHLELICALLKHANANQETIASLSTFSSFNTQILSFYALIQSKFDIFDRELLLKAIEILFVCPLEAVTSYPKFESSTKKLVTLSFEYGSTDPRFSLQAVEFIEKLIKFKISDCLLAQLTARFPSYLSEYYQVSKCLPLYMTKKQALYSSLLDKMLVIVGKTVSKGLEVSNPLSKTILNNETLKFRLPLAHKKYTVNLDSLLDLTAQQAFQSLNLENKTAASEAFHSLATLAIGYEGNDSQLTNEETVLFIFETTLKLSCSLESSISEVFSSFLFQLARWLARKGNLNGKNVLDFFINQSSSALHGRMRDIAGSCLAEYVEHVYLENNKENSNSVVRYIVKSVENSAISGTGYKRIGGLILFRKIVHKIAKIALFVDKYMIEIMCFTLALVKNVLAEEAREVLQNIVREVKNSVAENKEMLLKQNSERYLFPSLKEVLGFLRGKLTMPDVFCREVAMELFEFIFKLIGEDLGLGQIDQFVLSKQPTFKNTVCALDFELFLKEIGAERQTVVEPSLEEEGLLECFLFSRIYGKTPPNMSAEYLFASLNRSDGVKRYVLRGKHLSEEEMGREIVRKGCKEEKFVLDLVNLLEKTDFSSCSKACFIGLNQGYEIISEMGLRVNLPCSLEETVNLPPSMRKVKQLFLLHLSKEHLVEILTNYPLSDWFELLRDDRVDIERIVDCLVKRRRDSELAEVIREKDCLLLGKQIGELSWPMVQRVLEAKLDLKLEPEEEQALLPRFSVLTEENLVSYALTLKMFSYKQNQGLSESFQNLDSSLIPKAVQAFKLHKSACLLNILSKSIDLSLIQKHISALLQEIKGKGVDYVSIQIALVGLDSALTECFLIPLLKQSSELIAEETFKAYFAVIKENLENPQILNVLEVLLDKLSPEKYKQVALDLDFKHPKELTKLLVVKLHDYKRFRSQGGFSLAAAAYSALTSVVHLTQNKESLFVDLLLRANKDKKEEMWDILLDFEFEPLPVETDFEEEKPDLPAINVPLTNTFSFSCEDVYLRLNKVESLELCSINKHPIMAKLTGTVKKMHSEYGNQSKWAYAFLSSIMESATKSVSGKVFFVRVILNCADVFSSYANEYAPFVLEYGGLKENGGKGLHYILRDITCHLIKHYNAPQLTKESVRLFSKYLANLVKSSGDSKNVIFKKNIELVREFCKKYSKHLFMEGKVLLDMMNVPVSQPTHYIWKVLAAQTVKICVNEGINIGESYIEDKTVPITIVNKVEELLLEKKQQICANAGETLSLTGISVRGLQFLANKKDKDFFEILARLSVCAGVVVGHSLIFPRILKTASSNDLNTLANLVISLSNYLESNKPSNMAEIEELVDSIKLRECTETLFSALVKIMKTLPKTNLAVKLLKFYREVSTDLKIEYSKMLAQANKLDLLVKVLACEAETEPLEQIYALTETLLSSDLLERLVSVVDAADFSLAGVLSVVGRLVLMSSREAADWELPIYEKPLGKSELRVESFTFRQYPLAPSLQEKATLELFYQQNRSFKTKKAQTFRNKKSKLGSFISSNQMNYVPVKETQNSFRFLKEGSSSPKDTLLDKWIVHQERRENSKASFIRQYSLGMVPDVCIKTSLFINCLEGILNKNEEIAAELLVLLFNCAAVEAGKSDKQEEFIGLLNNMLNKAQKGSFIVAKTVLRIVYNGVEKHPEYMPSEAKVTALGSQNPMEAVLILEQIADRKEKRVSLLENSSEWVSLYKLYKQINLTDIAAGILDKIAVNTADEQVLSKIREVYLSPFRQNSLLSKEIEQLESQIEGQIKETVENLKLEANANLGKWENIEFDPENESTYCVLLNNPDKIPREDKFSFYSALKSLEKMDIDNLVVFKERFKAYFLQYWCSLGEHSWERKLNVFFNFSRISEIEEFLNFSQNKTDLSLSWTSNFPPVTGNKGIYCEIIASRSMMNDQLALESDTSKELSSISWCKVSQIYIKENLLDLAEIALSQALKTRNDVNLANKHILFDYLKAKIKILSTEEKYGLLDKSQFSAKSSKLIKILDNKKSEIAEERLKIQVDLLRFSLALKQGVTDVSKEIDYFETNLQEDASKIKLYRKVLNFSLEFKNEDLFFTGCTALLALGDEKSVVYIPKLLETVLKKKETLGNEFEARAKAIDPLLFGKWSNQLIFYVNSDIHYLLRDILKRVLKVDSQCLFFPFSLLSTYSEIHNSRPPTELFLELDAFYSKNTTLLCFREALDDLTSPDMRFNYFLERCKQFLTLAKENKLSPEALLVKLEGIKQYIYQDCISVASRHCEVRGSLNAAYAADVSSLLSSSFLDSDTLRELIAEGDYSAVGKVLQQDFGQVMEYNKRLAEKIMTGHVNLEVYSAWMSNYQNENVNQGGIDMPNTQGKVKITGFSSNLLVLNSIRKPKKLSVFGSDEKVYDFLVKGGEDLRLDQRITELFGVFNWIFNKHSECREKSISLSTFGVFPATVKVGMVEWLKDTLPLGNVIEFSMQQLIDSPSFDIKNNSMQMERRLHLQNNHGDGSFVKMHLKQLLSSQHEREIAALKKAQNLIPSNCLKLALINGKKSAESVIKSKATFMRKYSALAVCSYILGIGDRHLENFLINNKTLEVFAIDFGVAFGAGVEQIVPELVPFRLTRQVTSVISPVGVRGVVEESMIRALRAVKMHKRRVLEYCEVFVNEPLVEWMKGGEEKEMKAEWIPFKKLATVSDKIEGRNPVEVMFEELKGNRNYNEDRSEFFKELLLGQGEYGQLRRKANKFKLSTEEQVRVLIEMATDPNLLARIWIGWAAFV